MLITTANIVYIDLQSIEHEDFESADQFLKYFASTITRKLRMDISVVSKIWQDTLGHRINWSKLWKNIFFQEVTSRLFLQ